jgi:hypothetical protein
MAIREAIMNISRRALSLQAILIGLCIWIPGPAPAECEIWPVNGHCYEAILQYGISWQTAREQCEAAGGYLATITSEAENEFVKSLFADDPAFWFVDIYNNALGPVIGGLQTDGSLEPDGGWRWHNGEAWSFTDWSPGQPDDAVGGQERLRYFRPGSTGIVGWDDVEVNNPFGHTRGYILEIGAFVANETVSWGVLKARYR